MDRLFIGNLTINSISNKFEQLKLFVQGKTDILVITETILDPTFPTFQFLTEGYSKSYCFDRNQNQGGILIYVQEDIPSKVLMDHTLPHDIEGIFVELNLRKNKWLLFESYHPPTQSDEYLLNHVKYDIDNYSKCYDKYMLIVDFHAEESEPCLLQFLFEINAKNIVKEPTCFKSLCKPSCIDHVITNSSSILKTQRQYQRNINGLIRFS